MPDRTMRPLIHKTQKFELVTKTTVFRQNFKLTKFHLATCVVEKGKTQVSLNALQYQSQIAFRL
jgi:hypothetical protein